MSSSQEDPDYHKWEQAKQTHTGPHKTHELQQSIHTAIDTREEWECLLSGA